MFSILDNFLSVKYRFLFANQLVVYQFWKTLVYVVLLYLSVMEYLLCC